MTEFDAAITPDTKDWTWVLERPCPECGYDSRPISGRDVPALIRENLAGWPAVLADPAVRERRRPDAWSPLEYACHVRDVYRIYLVRLHLILTDDDPAFPNWDQDETAVVDRYAEQDPAVVEKELVAAGETIAAGFESVPADAWERTGTRSDGAHFTVETIARYFVHDPIHHLHDVRSS